jgi:hypothetical protein
MYHQERLIEGILHYRTSPTSKWEVATIEMASKRISILEEKVKSLEEIKRKLLKGIDDE